MKVKVTKNEKNELNADFPVDKFVSEILQNDEFNQKVINEIKLLSAIISSLRKENMILKNKVSRNFNIIEISIFLLFVMNLIFIGFKLM